MRAGLCLIHHHHDDDGGFHNKPAHAVPLASARQRPENKKGNRAGHLPERAVEGQLRPTFRLLALRHPAGVLVRTSPPLNSPPLEVRAPCERRPAGSSFLGCLAANAHALYSRGSRGKRTPQTAARARSGGVAARLCVQGPCSTRGARRARATPTRRPTRRSPRRRTRPPGAAVAPPPAAAASARRRGGAGRPPPPRAESTKRARGACCARTGA